MLCGFVTVAVLTRWPVRSEYLFGWDSVNYALAMDDWDLGRHRPHPPGYIAYVVLGKLARGFGFSHNDALQLVSMVAIGIAAYVWWRLGLGLGLSRLQALLGAGLLLSSPLVWLYSAIAEIYALDLLATLLVVGAATRVGDQRRSHLRLTLAFAFAAAVRLPTAVLLLPLTLVGRAGAARRAAADALGVAAVAASFALVDEAFLQLFVNQFIQATEGSRVGSAAGQGLEALNRSARDVLRALMMSGVGTLGLLGYAAVRRVAPPLPTGTTIAWAAPMVLVFLTVHFGKPGYLLPVLPLICLYAVGGGHLRNASAIGMVTVAIALNASQFLWVSSLDADRTGASRRYADKSFAEKLATELNPVAFATADAVERMDEELREVLSRADAPCAQRRVIVIGAGASVDWRRAMFYLPEHTVVRFDDVTLPVIVGQSRAEQVITSSHQWLSDCTPLWLSAASPPLTSGVAREDPPGSGVWTLEGDIAFATAGGVRLTIAVAPSSGA